MKRKEILFEIFDVFRVEEEKMIVFTPRGLYDRVHTINYRTCILVYKLSSGIFDRGYMCASVKRYQKRNKTLKHQNNKDQAFFNTPAWTCYVYVQMLVLNRGLNPTSVFFRYSYLCLSILSSMYALKDV